MIDHIGINVPDLEAAKSYYNAMMPALGYEPFFITEKEFSTDRRARSREPPSSSISLPCRTNTNGRTLASNISRSRAHQESSRRSACEGHGSWQPEPLQPPAVPAVSRDLLRGLLVRPPRLPARDRLPQVRVRRLNHARVDRGRPSCRRRSRSCSLTIADVDFELYFEVPGRSPRLSVDPFVISALLPAMRAGTPLVVESPVSAELLTQLPQIQKLFATWRPGHLHPIEIRADATSNDRAWPPGHGAFISLGVDSHYTLRMNEETLTHLLTIRNFDIAPLAPEIWDRISHNARRVAEHHGKALIEIDTNVRDLIPGIGWKWLHGPALAAVAHLLRNEIGTAYISASQMDPPLGPWGTHPELDPLWSTDAIEVVHFGPRSRVEKLLEIADDPMVLETLRACLSAEDSLYNCGRCAKCIVAMITLEAIAKLNQCPTLPDEVDPALIRTLDLTQFSRRVDFKEALAAAATGRELAGVDRSAEEAIACPKIKRALHPVIKPLRGLTRNFR